MANIEKVLRSAWECLCEVLGEKAYARYRDYVLAHGRQPMTPEAFYVWKQNHKYSQPNRCC